MGTTEPNRFYFIILVVSHQWEFKSSAVGYTTSLWNGPLAKIQDGYQSKIQNGHQLLSNMKNNNTTPKYQGRGNNALF